MAQVLLHSVLPEASSEEYAPFQSVDFLILAPGRKLVRNSIRIEGDIYARKDTTSGWLPTAVPANPPPACSAVDFDSNVKICNQIGAHAFFDSFSCETQSRGVLENLQNYGRHCKMVASSTLAADDLNTSKFIAEGRGPMEINGNYVLQPVVDQAFLSGTDFEQWSQRSPGQFSIAPQVCFNRSQGGEYAFDANGFIRVSCILAANSDALFGGNGAGGANYVLKNLNCRYVTTADDGVSQPIMMRSYVNVVSSIQSTATTVSARVPSTQVNAVSVSFAKQSNVNSTEFSSVALETLPQWDNISYLFSNTMSNAVTYVIKDRGDAIQKGIESLDNAGHQQVSARTLKGNDGNIMGLAFNEFLDLTSQKFTMNFNLLSDTITAAPMNAYLYFSTIISM
tara:strand:- start:4482 stop:5669 length:1188 start_codon:yes stop_codon:yes gene_type:complete